MTLSTDGYRESLYSALKEYRPGSFCIGGALNDRKEFIAPDVVVEGLGPIDLPLARAQAEELASSRFRQDPSGNAINDNNAGPYLQLSPDQFRLADNGWDECLRFLVNNEVVRGFGILDNIIVVPQLDRLLLLQPGESVPPHRESDKEVWGIYLGTLVLVLPSSHVGGELLVRHAGQQKKFAFVQETPSQVLYAAHYADCEQEFLPVQKGYQLVLLYNISYQGVREKLKPPDNSVAVTKIREAVMAWSMDAKGPQKMVVPLEECFIMGNRLSFETIRGSDRAKVEALMQSAEDAATLIKTVQSARDALEDACTSGGHLSAGQATTVLHAVMEHGRLADMEELRCALKAVQQADLKRLSSAQLSRMAKIVEEDAKSLRLMEERPGDSTIVPVCAFCKSTAEKKHVEKLRRCGRCLIPFYCGIECQKAHRKLHKPYCKAATE